MAKLKHPRIVQYFYSVKRGNKLYIYMEYMNCGSVKDKLNKEGPLSESMTRKYGKFILEGLCYLHKKCIIHRDIKASNVLFDRADNVKLADFGISTQMLVPCSGKAEEYCNTRWRGTVHYMPKEVMEGKNYGRRADIWSYGATMVEMLTGHPPMHEAQLPTVIFKIGTEEKVDLHLPVSIELRNMIDSIFVPEKERPRSEQLLKHPWFNLQ